MALALTQSMITKIAIMAAFPAVLLASQPAGRNANAIPEPTHLALFAFGITGVLLGRRLAQKRKDGDED
ncbi:PEP-CTERM sorting domain-containing protein [Novosphingobium sp. TH158]|uniref:PEP-CTERM sorting domain-containing protein n=1 Tax=Novosphingobium sp. TH158 TaxID=2067455 RepID=UPI000C7C0E41|nr:PEP-CTERM sorting domain-containing protein [Novosphingobium sp. TH158]PLK27448.1 hypothetical protein C0V78_11530 [Novosphingobium sp. TH158]